MGLHVYWEDEQKLIIRQVYDLTWTWDEFLKAFEEIRRLGGEVDYPIGMISEIGLIRSVPPNAILYGARGIRSLPANINLTVMVTSSTLALSFLRVILSVGQFQNIRTAPTVKIARQMIAEKQASQTTKMRV